MDSLFSFRQPIMGAKDSVFLFESLDLITSTTVLGVLYGIAFALYCLCTYSLYLQLQKPDRRRRAIFLLGYTSLLLFCATVILVLNARMIKVTYVNHADFPGGPLAYENSYNSTTMLNVAVGSSLGLIVEVLTVAIQVRCDCLHLLIFTECAR